jgi:hypothetical protein
MDTLLSWVACRENCLYLPICNHYICQEHWLTVANLRDGHTTPSLLAWSNGERAIYSLLGAIHPVKPQYSQYNLVLPNMCGILDLNT